MKVLSIKNPWADIILRADKDIENRTWKLPLELKGAWFLVHATKKNDDLAMRKIKDLNPEIMSAQNGKIIGAIRISDCVTNSKSKWAQKGQNHWVISDKILFKPSDYIEAKGQLGLWNFDLPDSYQDYFDRYWMKKGKE